MSRTIPIIQLHRVLIVSIQIDLSDNLVVDLKNDLAHELRARDVDGLIIELSGVDVIDSYIARALSDVANIGRLMGVRTVLVGIDPSMASTLVDMGMALRKLETALNLEAAVELFGPKRASTAPDEVEEWLARSRTDVPDPD